MKTVELRAEAMGESGHRVCKLLELATTQDPDLPAAEAALDLIMTAAALMLAVHTESGGEICPPMRNCGPIDRAMHAVSELAAWTGKKQEADPS